MSANMMAQTTIYVNYNIGNDTSGNRSSETPYKIFHKGYISASAGDILDVTGIFNWANLDETGNVATSGYTIGKNLTIQGQGEEITFIQADETEDTADRRVFTISSGNDCNSRKHDDQAKCGTIWRGIYNARKI
jgi:hypothetical protein